MSIWETIQYYLLDLYARQFFVGVVYLLFCLLVGLVLWWEAKYDSEPYKMTDFMQDASESLDAINEIIRLDYGDSNEDTVRPTHSSCENDHTKS